jgi:hypothetical protein
MCLLPMCCAHCGGALREQTLHSRWAAPVGCMPYYPHPLVCAPSGCWRPHAVRALLSAYLVDVGARILSTPSRLRPRSRPVRVPFAARA